MRTEQRRVQGKDHLFFKKAINIGLISIALLGLIGTPFRNSETSQMVVSALIQHESVYCTIPEAHPGEAPFDAALVPGSGVYFDDDELAYVPNTFQRRRNRAVALAYVGGMILHYEVDGPPVIIMLDGEVAPGIDKNINKKDVQAQVISISQGAVALPDEAIIIENNSINTATNMREAKELVDQFGLGNVLVITDDFHLLRSQLLACANNIPSAGLSVEQLTAQFDSTNFRTVDAPNRTIQMKFRQAKELLEVLSLPWDPQGNVSIALKKIKNGK